MKRILVCEDDRGIRGFLEHFLRRRGHQVDMAGDGIDCLAKLSQADYDAVILDLLMPSMEGGPVIDWLRATRLALLAKTIVVSASAAAMKAPPRDVAAFFAKPFDLRDLVERLDGILNDGQRLEAPDD